MRRRDVIQALCAYSVWAPSPPAACAPPHRERSVTASSYARRRQDRGHTSHLKRMQSSTDPADRTGTIGVEAFDAANAPCS